MSSQQQRSLLRFTTERTEVISNFGQILGESVKFKEVQEDLSKYLGEGISDEEICIRLNITDDQLTKFRPRVKPITPPSNPEELLIYKNKQVEFWEFVRETSGDIYLVSWHSYFQVLKNVAEELKQTLHAVDKGVSSWNIPQYHEEPEYVEAAPTSLKVGAAGRGVFILREDLIRLMRLAFVKQYPKFIQEHVKQKKIDIFRIRTLEVDKTTLLPPFIKGEKRETGRKIIHVEVTILEELFRNLYLRKRQELQEHYSYLKDLKIEDAWEVLDLIKTEKAKEIKAEKKWLYNKHIITQTPEVLEKREKLEKREELQKEKDKLNIDREKPSK
jgi:hypothetical protein